MTNLFKMRSGLIAMAILFALLLVSGWLIVSKSTASTSSNVPYANWDCQFEANTRGLVQSTNIYLRNNSQITLASDDQRGNRTWVTLPTLFAHGSGTSPRMDLPLPNGTFKVIMKVRLAGWKNPGPVGVWISKRNVVKLEVHDGSVGGPIVASTTLDINARVPTDYTMTTNVYSPNQPVDTFKSYYIMIYFDKYDNNASNDGQCGMEMRVRSI